jgi:elongation factor G
LVTIAGVCYFHIFDAPPEVALYCETITRTVEVDFAHKKLIGSAGEFAKVRLRLEPLPSGTGLQFMNDSTEDVIPAEWTGGIEEGIQHASRTGVLVGYPVVDLRVTLVGGAYHEMDSTWHSFSLAAQGAFWDGMRKAEPRILIR